MLQLLVRFTTSGDFRLQSSHELRGEMRIRVSIGSLVVAGSEMKSVIGGEGADYFEKERVA